MTRRHPRRPADPLYWLIVAIMLGLTLWALAEALSVQRIL